MRTRTAILLGIMLGVITATTPPGYGATAISVAGNDDHVDLRYGYVKDKGEIGGYVSYGDSIISQGGWTAGGGVYATWDVYDRPANVIGYEIDAALYIGGMAGVINVV